MAIESVKSVYPSEAEQLKKIIREVEAKLLSVKRQTKNVAMEIQINKYMVKNFGDFENLLNELNVSVANLQLIIF